jgi:hypothetical protein
MADQDSGAPAKHKARLPGLLAAGLLGALFALTLAGAGGWHWRLALLDWLLGDERVRLEQVAQDHAALARQVDQLALDLRQSESRTAAAPPAAVNERLADLAADIDRLRRTIPPEAMILQLTERTEAAERTMHDFARQQATSQAVLLTIGQLKDAIDRGDPFTLEWAALHPLLQADETALLAGVVTAAETGIPRKEALKLAFAPLAIQLLSQEQSARGPGLWEEIRANLGKLVRVRRMDGQGNDAEAVLGRAEAALAHDDWDGALAEMRALPGPFLATATPWISQTQQRLAADRALSKLGAIAASRAAPR